MKCRDLFVTPEGKIWAFCCHPQGRIVLFDSTGIEKKAFYPEYPHDKLHQDENYIPKSFAFQYKCIVNQSENRLYNLCITAGHIEVFDIKNDSLSRIKNNLYYLPQYTNTSNNREYGVLFSKEYKQSLFNPELTDRYIYAGYEIEPPQQHSYIAFDALFQFDLEGQPLAHYKLSQRISRFCIDSTNNILYAISSDPSTLEPCIYYTSLN